MTAPTTMVEPRFVDNAPLTLEPGVVYVSIGHKTVLHLCACGCGHEIVTPLAPHRWRLLYDGETVSLEPSVGNSVLECRSHYFITRNRVDWRRPMTDAGIEWARARDARALARADGTLNDGGGLADDALDEELLEAGYEELPDEDVPSRPLPPAHEVSDTDDVPSDVAQAPSGSANGTTGGRDGRRAAGQPRTRGLWRRLTGRPGEAR